MIEIVVSKRNGRPGHSNIRRPPLVATEPETGTGRSRRRPERRRSRLKLCDSQDENPPLTCCKCDRTRRPAPRAVTQERSLTTNGS
jgi:hypothetical protein